MNNHFPSKNPIPSHAKSVFSGYFYDVLQWDQEMFDGSYEVFEMIRKVDTTTVIAVTQDHKILVTLQEQPLCPRFVALPGGMLDSYDEIPEVGAKRELLEETGYNCGSIELLFAETTSNTIDYHDFVYIAKKCTKIADQKLDSGEKIEVLELDFGEFVTKMLDKTCRHRNLTMFLLRLINDNKLIEFQNQLFH